MQMRLPFAAPAQPVELSVTLLGTVVLVSTPADAVAAASAHLTASGISTSPEPSGGLRFPAALLARLIDLPAQVKVDADELVQPLVELAMFPSPPGHQATVDLNARGELVVRWFDGTEVHDVVLPSLAVPAFLAADFSFTASSRAWEQLRSTAEVPPIAGRCSQNMDGFVEITALRQQLVERSPLPALFRLDDTHFGIPSAFADRLTLSDGFVWEGTQPSVHADPVRVDVPVVLADHVTSAASSLAERLSGVRAAVVDWPSGLGRRIAVLAALSALDAWPALVVCEPSGLWLWRRHAEAFGLSASLRASDAHIRLVTYHDLGRGVSVPDAATLVFDELAPRNAFVCHRLDGIDGAYRVAIPDGWPAMASEVMELMSVVRPVEFRSDVPCEVRYPLRPAERLAEHVGVYRLADPGVVSDSDVVFRRSSVVRTVANPAQQLALDAAYDRYDDPDVDPVEALTEVLSMVARGSDMTMSSKAAAVLDVVGQIADDRRVVVTCRNPETAELLTTLCRPWRAVRWTPGGAPPMSRVVVWAGFPLPDLSGFDEVIIADYPRSLVEFDAAVGVSDLTPGPMRVRVVHMDGSPDDRLAILAMLRAEGVVAPLPAPDGSWSVAEAEYLLSR